MGGVWTGRFRTGARTPGSVSCPGRFSDGAVGEGTGACWAGFDWVCAGGLPDATGGGAGWATITVAAAATAAA